MKTWQGLNAEEIASIPNDEYRLQKVERILRERNKLRELADAEIKQVYFETIGLEITIPEFLFARAILKKARKK